jgi:hypothetical protein
MKAGRYGKSPFKNQAVPAKNPVAPTPAPSAAKTSGPMQHTEASNAALNPPTESIVTELFGGLGLEGASSHGHMDVTSLFCPQPALLFPFPSF